MGATVHTLRKFFNQSVKFIGFFVFIIVAGSLFHALIVYGKDDLVQLFIKPSIG